MIRFDHLPSEWLFDPVKQEYVLKDPKTGKKLLVLAPYDTEPKRHPDSFAVSEKMCAQ